MSIIARIRRIGLRLAAILIREWSPRRLKSLARLWPFRREMLEPLDRPFVGLEPLEPRLLLSGAPTTVPLEDEIEAAQDLGAEIKMLEAWAERIAGQEQFAEQLTGVARNGESVSVNELLMEPDTETPGIDGLLQATVLGPMADLLAEDSDLWDDGKLASSRLVDELGEVAGIERVVANSHEGDGVGLLVLEVEVDTRVRDTWQLELDGAALPDLSGGADELEWEIQKELELEGDAELTGSLVLGVLLENDSQGGVNSLRPIEQGLFLGSQSELTASIIAEADNLNLDLELGFLEVQVDQGRANLAIKSRITAENDDRPWLSTNELLGDAPAEDDDSQWLSTDGLLSEVPADFIDEVAAELAASLPLSGQVGEWDIVVDDPVLEAKVDQLFAEEGGWQLQVVQGELHQDVSLFTQIDAQQWHQLLGQVRETLSLLPGSTLSDRLKMPLLDGRALNDLVPWGEAWAEQILEPTLQDADGGMPVPKFTTIQGFVRNLERSLGLQETLILPAYDPETRELSFGVRLEAEAVFEDEEALGWDFEVPAKGPWDGAELSGELHVQAKGVIEGRIGIDLTPLGSGFGTFDENTSLGALNGGRGVAGTAGRDNAGAGPQMRIVGRNGELFEPDLRSAKTLGDVQRMLQSAATEVGIDLTVEIDQHRHRLRLIDETEVEPAEAQPLRVETINNGWTALDLGLLNPEARLNGVVEGTPLHGDHWTDRLFFENVTMTGSTSVAADATMPEPAQLGFLELMAEKAQLQGSFDFAWDATGGFSGGHAPLVELGKALRNVDGASLAAPVHTGSAELVLAELTVVADHDALPTLAAGASLLLTWPEATDPQSLDVTADGFAELEPLADLDEQQLFDALEQAIAYLSDDLLSSDALNADLPLLDRTVLELLSIDDGDQLAQRLRGATEELLTPATGIDGAVTTGGAGTSEQMANLDYNGASRFLSLGLELTDSIEAQHPFALELGDGEELLPTEGSGDLTVMAAAKLVLDVGLLLEDPTSPQVMLGSDSGLTVELDAAADALRFSTALGPMALYVGHPDPESGDELSAGMASIDNGADEPARFDVGVQEGAGPWRVLGELTADEVAVEIAARAKAELPLLWRDPLNGEIKPVNEQQPTFVFEAPDLGELPQQVNWQVPEPELATLVDEVRDLLDFEGLDADVSGVVDGLDRLLQWMDVALAGEALATDLPVIGDQLGEGFDVLRELRGAVALLRQELHTGSLTAERLREVLAETLPIEEKDIDITFPGTEGQGGPLEAGAVQVDLTLEDDNTFEWDLDAALGLPALGLSLENAQLKVMAGYSLDLAFGVSRDHGFYIDPEGTGLQLDAKAQIDPGAELQGQLGWLEISAGSRDGVDANWAEGRGVEAEFQFDPEKVSGATDGLLTPGELMAAPVGEWASLEGGADLHLELEAGVFDADLMPSLHADFGLQWDLAWDFTGSLVGEVPKFYFENVSIDAGDFLRRFAEPVVSQVADVLSPFEPILDVMTRPLPVISMIMQRDVDLLDLANAFGDGVANREMVDAAAEILALSEWLDHLLRSDTTAPIDLGGFSSDGDPRQAGELGLSDMDVDTPSETEHLEGTPAGALYDSYVDLSGGGFSMPLIEQPSQALGLLLGRHADLFVYDSPLLEAGFDFRQVFATFFGVLDVGLEARLGVEAGLSIGYDTYGLQQFLHSGHTDRGALIDGFFLRELEEASSLVELRGRLGAFGSVGAGVNLGLASLSGEAGVTGGLEASVAAGLVDSFALDGDPSKVRAADLFSDRLTDVLRFHGELAVGLWTWFEVEACVGIGWFSKCSSWGNEWEIARIALLEFEHEPMGGEPDAVADFEAGVLTLEMTSDDDRFNVFVDDDDQIQVRGNGTLHPESWGVNDVERIEAETKSGENVVIVGAGVEADVDYTGGSGNDRVTVAGRGDVEVDLSGGGDNAVTITDTAEGDLEVTGGDGNDRVTFRGQGKMDVEMDVEGTAGNNTIRALTAAPDGERHRLVGGTGNDTIHASDGGDFIDGVAGNNQLYGGDGDDEIHGGEGRDTIDAGEGDNRIYATDGDNHITAGFGDDWIFGGSGRDIMEVLGGDNWIEGGGGDNVIRSGHGQDVIWGTKSPEDLRPENREDYFELQQGRANVPEELAHWWDDGGEGGDSTISAAGGINWIIGGSGSDMIDVSETFLGNVIYAGTSAEGGGAEDDENTIIGGRGDDIIFGGSGNDTIDGAGGDNWIEGRSGNNTIRGGTGNDILWAWHAPGDLTPEDHGELAELRNEVFQRDDNSERPLPPDHEALASGYAIDTNADDNDHLNVIDARAGGHNWLFGASGNAQVFAGEGNDYIDGGDGDDEIEAVAGDNWILGGPGNDTIRGGSGNNVLWGDAPDSDASDWQSFLDFASDENLGVDAHSALPLDISDGPVGNSNLLIAGSGAAGTNWLIGGRGNDHLRGGPGEDFLFGGPGNDRIYGGTGADYIVGGGGSNYIQGRGANGNTIIAGTNAAADNEEADLPTNANTIHAGDGGDVIYGGIGSDRIHAGEGIDRVYGVGGDNEIFARGGEPTEGERNLIQGGSGNDQIHAGEGHSWIHGGDGNDSIYDGPGHNILIGGAGSDEFILHVPETDGLDGGSTTQPNSSRIFGHEEDQPQPDDDHDVNTLRINGTGGNDTILLAQNPDQPRELRVLYNGQFLDLPWRHDDDDATPRLQQFHITGNQGNDLIGFYREDLDAFLADPEHHDLNTDELGVLDDLDTVTARNTRAPVGHFEGGPEPGRNVLVGGPERDLLIGSERIDHGPTDDFLFGFGGDDRLWGTDPDDHGFDGNPSHGNNYLYSGPGNNDVFGGGGDDHLFAGPRLIVHEHGDRESLESYLLQNEVANLLSGDTDHLVVDEPAAPGAIETPTLVGGADDTAGTPGYNRLYGGPGNDRLFGGYGLDFLHGGGFGDAHGQNNILYNVDNRPFGADGDSHVAGLEQDTQEAWLETVREHERVWHLSPDPERAHLKHTIKVQYAKQQNVHFATVESGDQVDLQFNLPSDLDEATVDDSGDESRLWLPLHGEGDAFDAFAAVIEEDGYDVILVDLSVTPENGEDQANHEIKVHHTVRKSVWSFGGEGNNVIDHQSGYDPAEVWQEFDGQPQFERYDERRDVIIGGEGNNVLFGGFGSTWIFGGPGSDLISGGLDGGEENFLFAGPRDNDDYINEDGEPKKIGSDDMPINTFQVVPDPHDPGMAFDRFFGSEGLDQVLFVGSAKRDFITIGFEPDDDRIGGIYELATLLPTEADEDEGAAFHAFIDDDDQEHLHWARARFRVTNVEILTIHGNRHGNWIYATTPEELPEVFDDVVRAGGWGINRQDIVRGAHLTLQVRSGTRPDPDGRVPAPHVIYGSHGDDALYGGDSADYIRGIAGSNRIEGGGGNDFIFGDDNQWPPENMSENHREHTKHRTEDDAWELNQINLRNGVPLTNPYPRGDVWFDNSESEWADRGFGLRPLSPAIESVEDLLPQPRDPDLPIAPALQTPRAGQDEFAALVSPTSLGLADAPLHFDATTAGFLENWPDHFTLDADNQERWFTFTILGDGGGVVTAEPVAARDLERERNFLRVLPHAHEWTTMSAGIGGTFLPGTQDLDTDGPMMHVRGADTSDGAAHGLVEFDLSAHLGAADYIDNATLHFEVEGGTAPNPEDHLEVWLLAEEADWQITAADGVGGAQRLELGAGEEEAMLPVGPADGFWEIDVTEAIRTALLADRTRVTLRLEASADEMDLTISPPSEQRIAGGGTYLEVTARHPGALIDIVHETGEPIVENTPVVDMRHMSAGTYYMRVHLGEDGGMIPPGHEVAPPVDFHIEATPPSRGAAHLRSADDLIFGNVDGDTQLGFNTIVGGSGADEVHGDGGAGPDNGTTFPDSFRHIVVAEKDEWQDRDDDDLHVIPDERDRIIPVPIDPEVTINDPGMLDAMDAQFGNNVPTRASELSQITYLDLSFRGIETLDDLRWFENLTTLTLAGNDLNLDTDVGKLAAPSADDRIPVAEGLLYDNRYWPTLPLENLSLALNRELPVERIVGTERMRRLDADFVAPREEPRIFNPAISSDGTLISFTTGGELYFYRPVDGLISRVDIRGVENTPPDAAITNAQLSADGSVVAFASRATNLVADFTNKDGHEHIYVYDHESDRLELVTVTNEGQRVDASATLRGISADGSTVLFSSRAENLSNDSNAPHGAYVRYWDDDQPATEMISIDDEGVAVSPRTPRLSADGNAVAFKTRQYHEDEDLLDEWEDVKVFRRDLESGTTELTAAFTLWDTDILTNVGIAISPDGSEAVVRYTPDDLDHTYGPVFSSDGNVFVWTRWEEAYAFDRTDETQERVSVNDDGVSANGLTTHLAPSGDGSRVAFVSSSTNLGVSNNGYHVYLRDRAEETTTLVSVDEYGTPIRVSRNMEPVISDGGDTVIFRDLNRRRLFAYDHDLGYAQLIDSPVYPSIKEAGFAGIEWLRMAGANMRDARSWESLDQLAFLNLAAHDWEDAPRLTPFFDLDALERLAIDGSGLHEAVRAELMSELTGRDAPVNVAYSHAEAPPVVHQVGTGRGDWGDVAGTWGANPASMPWLGTREAGDELVVRVSEPVVGADQPFGGGPVVFRDEPLHRVEDDSDLILAMRDATDEQPHGPIPSELEDALNQLDVDLPEDWRDGLPEDWQILLVDDTTGAQRWAIPLEASIVEDGDAFGYPVWVDARRELILQRDDSDLEVTLREHHGGQTALRGGGTSVLRLDARELDDGIYTLDLSDAVASEAVRVLAMEDAAGNALEGESTLVRFGIDREPPVSSHEIAGDTGDDLWFLGPVDIELSATDAVGFVDRIEYHFGDGDWQVYDADAPPMIETPGPTTLHYRGVDVAGSVEQANEVEVIIADTDTTVSSHELSGDRGQGGWFVSDVAVTLSADDSAEGVILEYHLGDGDWQVYDTDAPPMIEAPGLTTLHYRAVDAADRPEASHEVEVKIDSEAPVAAIVDLETDSAGRGFVDIRWDDEVSGLDVATISRRNVDLGEDVRVTGVEAEGEDAGWYRYLIDAGDHADGELGVELGELPVADVAGNRGDPRTGIESEIGDLVLDTTPPMATLVNLPGDGEAISDGEGYFEVQWKDPAPGVGINFGTLDVGNLSIRGVSDVSIHSVELLENDGTPTGVVRYEYATSEENNALPEGVIEVWTTADDQNAVTDRAENRVREQRIGHFRVDRLPPVARLVSPSTGTFLTEPVQEIQVRIEDRGGSTVAPNSVELSSFLINGDRVEEGTLDHENGVWRLTLPQPVAANRIHVQVEGVADELGNIADVMSAGMAASTPPPAAELAIEPIFRDVDFHEFTVTFQAIEGAIDTGSVIENDHVIHITGPNDFAASAQYIAIDEDSDGTPRTATYRLPAPDGGWQREHDGTYTVHLKELQGHEVTDTDGRAVPAQELGSFIVHMPGVFAQHLFYNKSSFDGHLPGPGVHNGMAIAPDKQALLPGQTASFANYTNYSRGLNGIMIDIAGLAQPGMLGVEDFEFAVGNQDDPQSWADAPAPVHVHVSEGAGLEGTDRVELIWEDGAISDTWLEITVLATGNSGLDAPDAFYFGHRAGDVTGDGRVTAEDVQLIRENQSGFGSADIDNAYDINRSGRVDLGDVIAARNTQDTEPLELISVPTNTAPSAEPLTAEASADTNPTMASALPDRLHAQAGWANGADSESRFDALASLEPWRSTTPFLDSAFDRPNEPRHSNWDHHSSGSALFGVDRLDLDLDEDEDGTILRIL